jgi:hypothetical protein
MSTSETCYFQSSIFILTIELILNAMKYIQEALLICLIIVSFTSKAQSPKDDLFQIDLRKNIQTETGTLVFYTLKDKAAIETINQRGEYFWYADGKLHSTFGGVSGEPLNGEFNSYYKMGNLKESGFFSLGLKNGKWTAWSESGKVKSTFTWLNGLLEGTFEEFDTQGKLMRTGMYSNNRMNGKVLTFENGVLVKEEKYKTGSITKTKLIAPLKLDSTVR